MAERAAPPDRILSAVLHELAEAGYPGCSLRAVARRAGVDPRLIGHYFTDKERMCAQALRRRCAEPPASAAPRRVAGPWPGPRSATPGARGFTAGPWEARGFAHGAYGLTSVASDGRCFPSGTWENHGAAAALTAVLLQVWEAEWPAGPALLAAALTHEASAALLGGLLTGLLDEVLAVAGADRSERTAMAASVLLGLALASRAGTPATDPPSRPVTAGLRHYLNVLLRERQP